MHNINLTKWKIRQTINKQCFRISDWHCVLIIDEMNLNCDKVLNIFVENHLAIFMYFSECLMFLKKNQWIKQTINFRPKKKVL